MAMPGEPSVTSSARFSGGIDTVISVEEVARQAQAIAQEVPVASLDTLTGNAPHLRIDNLRAGYGRMEILHDFNLRIGRKQALCLIGPIPRCTTRAGRVYFSWPSGPSTMLEAWSTSRFQTE